MFYLRYGVGHEQSSPVSVLGSLRYLDLPRQTGGGAFLDLWGGPSSNTFTRAALVLELITMTAQSNHYAINSTKL